LLNTPCLTLKSKGFPGLGSPKIKIIIYFDW
jgi:hypothetical protein